MLIMLHFRPPLPSNSSRTTATTVPMKRWLFTSVQLHKTMTTAGNGKQRMMLRDMDPEEWRRLRQEEQKEDEARHVRALAIISEGASDAYGEDHFILKHEHGAFFEVLMFTLFDCCCGGEMKHRMKIAVVDVEKMTEK
ncbi:hypothetical protein niasHT_037873 [Heterodera trifolii]|uniref:Uncharacterized protein n=1 Tax=Heterodera trifolii TaxID=157864 RepID=A0ABD2J035_9BILA